MPAYQADRMRALRRHVRISNDQAGEFWERVAALMNEFNQLPREGDLPYTLVVSLYPVDYPQLPGAKPEPQEVRERPAGNSRQHNTAVEPRLLTPVCCSSRTQHRKALPGGEVLQICCPGRPSSDTAAARSAISRIAPGRSILVSSHSGHFFVT